MAYLPEPIPIESLLRLVLNSPPRTPTLSFASKRPRDRAIRPCTLDTRGQPLVLGIAEAGRAVEWCG